MKNNNCRKYNARDGDRYSVTFVLGFRKKVSYEHYKHKFNFK